MANDQREFVNSLRTWMKARTTRQPWCQNVDTKSR
jgi:hypothetical protein